MAVADIPEHIRFIGDFYTVFPNRPLGRGTFAEVFLAEDRRTSTRVCVKRIATQANDEDQIRRIETEITALSLASNHPNIVRYFDHADDNGCIWLFMEHLELGDLHNVLRQRHRRLRENDVMTLFQNGASAVQFLHTLETPIIHRDIKLKNILVKQTNNYLVYKLADFGQARILGDEINGRDAAMYTVAGTQYFMAPEFFRNGEHGYLRYDSSVDIFSLGLVYVVAITYDGADADLVPRSGKL